MAKEGQISVEYLVILAAVLVIAFIAVYLIGGFTAFGAATLESQSRGYWAGATPFSINAYKVSGTSMDVELVNNDLDQLTLTSFVIDGSTVYSTSTAFNSGESKTITITLGTSCGSAGDSFSYNNLVFLYTKGSISGIRETGQKALIGKCS